MVATLSLLLCLTPALAGPSLGSYPAATRPSLDDEAPEAAPAQPSFPREELMLMPVATEGTEQRSAYVWVPEGEGPFPVVVAIHGGKRRDGTDMVGRFEAARRKGGIILVYPNGGDVPRGKGWVGPDKPYGLPPDRDVAYFRALVEQLKTELPVDPDRIYVTGMSGGGYMADLLWCEMSDTFAGFGVVSRAMPKMMAETCQPATPRPYLLMLGTADDGVVNEYQLPLDETRAFIRSKLGCAEVPAVDTVLPDRGDSLEVRHRRWTCGTVAYDDYEIAGGGHQWPGVGRPKADKTVDVDATDVILEAFGL